MTPNYSLHAIPVYWVLALFPHIHAVSALKKALEKTGNKWDNINSRNPETLSKYQKAVPAEAWGAFQRSEAAHKNMLENAPFFVAAVVAGVVAGLDAETMNTSVGAYLVLRTLYVAQYMRGTAQKTSYLRSLNWVVSVGVLMRVFWKAGNAVAARA